MAIQSLITTSKITFECLDVLENELAFSRAVNRDYDDQFAQTGAKIGATVNVRKPTRYTVGSGPVIDPQATVETYVPVTLTDQLNVPMVFTSADLALHLDDFRTRIIKPAMAALANQIDYLGLSRMYKATHNLVGTVGQLTGTPTSAQAVTAILQAGQRLDENATPMDDMRSFVISPATNTGIVQAQSSLFNPATTISSQFKKGALGSGVLGFDFARDQNVVSHTAGTLAAPVANAVNGAQGATNTVQSDATTPFSVTINALGGTVTVGSVITFSGVNAVNPQSRQSTGSLQNFVVVGNGTAGTDVGAADTTVQILPDPVFSGAFQNVTASGGAIPANATLTVLSGYSSNAYPQNIAFHKNAFTLACADLPLPKGNGEAARAASKAAGLSVRLIQNWYDARTDQFLTRLDVLIGWKAIYPELAVRVTG